MLQKDLNELESFCLRRPAAAGYPFRAEIALETCSKEGLVSIAVLLLEVDAHALFLPFL